MVTITEREIREIVLEELSRSDVQSMIDKKITSMYDSSDFKKSVREIAVEVVDDFFKTMYNKRSFWKTSIKNG